MYNINGSDSLYYETRLAQLNEKLAELKADNSRLSARLDRLEAFHSIIVEMPEYKQFLLKRYGGYHE